MVRHRMYPLLYRDGVALQYLVLTLFYNYLLGYNPFLLRRGSFIKLLSLVRLPFPLSLPSLASTNPIASFCDTHRSPTPSSLSSTPSNCSSLPRRTCPTSLRSRM